MQTRQAKRKGLEGTSRVESQEADDINGHTVTANDIFDNDLVFSLIGDYLWIPDLKILRQTSKSLLAKVNGLPKFVKNLKLTITDETVKETGLNPRNNSVDWRSAKIIVIHTSPSSYKRIPANSLTHLQLDYPIELHEEHETPKTRKELSLNRSSCYRFLRSLVFNLKSLSLDFNLLRYDIPTTTLSGLVGTLEELNFTGQVIKDQDEFLDPMPRRELRNIEINMAMIGSFAWRLKSITIDWDFKMPAAEGLTAILAASKNTIEKIKFICQYGFQLLIGIHELQFPRLKELHVIIEGDDCPAFTGFLNLQPKMESLLVALNGDTDPDFLEAVRRNSTSKLRKLQFSSSFSPADVDFRLCDFIQELGGLKKFKIGWDDIDESENSLADILSYLPPTLKVLAFWDYIVPNDIVESIQERLISALIEFPNLTRLSISKCGELFSDDVLQAICRSCTLLRELDFTADHITDFGLTGERGSESYGVYLHNLKGLRVLSMGLEAEDVASVSTAGLVKAIQFRELKVAELTSLNIPDEALFQLAENNPSLETLSRSVYGNSPVSEFSECKRFSRLLSINPRLTRIYTNHIHKRGGRTMNLQQECGEICHKPSYGVPGRTLNVSATRRARSTMKVFNSTKFNSDRMYCYDL